MAAWADGDAGGGAAGDAGGDVGGVVSRARRVLRPFVATALTTPVGPELVSQLMELTGRDDLSAREWAEVTAGWKQVVCFAHAGQLAAVAGLDEAMSADPNGRAVPGRTDPVRPAADELAPVLGIAPQAASALVALSRRVQDRLPAAADALADGRMDPAQLRITDRVARDLPRATARKVEAAAVRWAPRCTAQQLRIALTSEAARLDPAHTASAVKRGVAERDVTCRPSPLPGCGRLVLDLPLISREAAWHAANTAARNTKKAGTRPDGTAENRTLAQLRADLAAAILTGQVDPHGAHVPTPGELAQLAEVQVVVAHDTLTGQGELPAHLPGTGPIDPGTVRDLAGRAPLRRLVADRALGTLLHRDNRTLAPEPPHDPTGRAPTASQVTVLQAALPQTELPQAIAPQTTASQAALPQTELPQAIAPQTTASRAALPQTELPQAIAPQTTASQAALPQIALSQAIAPQTDLPQATGRPAPGHGTVDGSGTDPRLPQLLTDPRLTQLLTDPVRASYTDDGARYRPSTPLRDHVHTRDATCVGPACSHPATGTQIDHTINHGTTDAHGVPGLTADDNLASLCERIHNAKTHGHWELEQPTRGTFVWTSPTGRVYYRTARPLVPGWRHRRERQQPRERPPPSPSGTR